MSTDLYCDDCYDDDPVAGELAPDEDRHDLYICVVLLGLVGLLVLALELAHGC